MQLKGAMAMSMAALSPNSVLASPIQVNPQIRTDHQVSVPQAAQDAQKSNKTAQTDTITISSQALKKADYKGAIAGDSADKVGEQPALQPAGSKSDAAKGPVQRYAVKAYGSVSANQ